MHECHCSPGWQGLECEKPCGSTSSGRLDLTVVMDVSGSIAANPRKDEYTFEFFENLLVQFEADTQVKLSIVSFSDSATLNLPLDFYSVEEVRDAVSDLIWVGQGTNITSGLEIAETQINTNDDVL